MYKNIVFDLGGVVVDFAPHDFLLDRFYDETVESKVFDITFGSVEWRQLDAGELDREAGNAAMLQKAAEAGCAFEVQSVLDDWYRMLKTRRRTVDVMKRLKKMGFSLYYLSNIPWDVYEEMQQRDFWPLFEGGVASCEAGTNKPDPRIFQLLIERYNLVCGETIFVDDNKLNTTAAYDLGITGIHYKGGASFLRALNACGIPIKEHLLW
ncbi:MAG TPA: HAD family phosphatase [Candidatus Fournierella merdipullorum]|uniref:HAD family phosphatase n=1 Tax=Candidatus Allofournierella merdipullorum TaxID=2838595 RepID=A0A9D2E624_9FIRM|nr:HAD family phosphatase [Candidatus Fournierella merdipullorum]HIZ31639.1 HAD family phosphatase [Candidatus Fournierella merdipullorum]